MVNYHRDKGPPRCALKVDLKKAYDTISWSCILGILRAMSRKLKNVKACLKSFNFHTFSNLQGKVVQARADLAHSQAALLDNPTDPGLVRNESLHLKVFYDLAIAEEGMLKQKSRIQWLKLGDQNTNFFHKAVKARNSRKSIKTITLENGSRTTDPDAIKQECVSHFKEVLGNNWVEPNQLASGNVDMAWSAEHLGILNNGVTNDEIKKTIFSIKDSKAPGPDGFSSLFFKKSWDIVGRDVMAAVTDFFSSGCLLKEMNCTIIALVPKIPNPSTMHDYRPISCCNTVYKCISKIIATRSRAVFRMLLVLLSQHLCMAEVLVTMCCLLKNLCLTTTVHGRSLQMLIPFLTLFVMMLDCGSQA